MGWRQFSGLPKERAMSGRTVQWMAMSVVTLLSAAARADEPAQPGVAPWPEIKVEGDFDNAQVTGVRVEGGATAEPRVILGGTTAVEGLPEKPRDVNRLLHFHLRLTHCRGRTVRFEVYLNKAATGPLHTTVPVVRYADGRIELARVTEVKSYGPALDKAGQPIKGLERVAYIFTHRFRDEPARVSYSMPLTNETLADLATELKGNRFVTINELGRTPLFDLPLRQFVVTDPTVPDKDKKGVWLYAGEDPWEMPGSYGCAGFLRFVAGDDPLAREFRRRFVVSVIPHVNPDALRRGDTNFYLDAAGVGLINTALSWKRTDIVVHERIKAALRTWKVDGRSLDFSATVHSSCFWTAVIRIDWAADHALAQKFIDEVYAKKYVPWAAGRKMGTPADMSGSLMGSLGAELYGDRLVHYGLHLEQIIFPVSDLLGTPAPKDLARDVLRCQQADLYTQGELLARAVAEFYGVKTDPKNVPPMLLCGDVSSYWGRPGETRTYTVLYRDTEGREPQYVRLNLGGKPVEMKREAGRDAVKGLLYQVTASLAAGTNDFFFETSNGAVALRYPPTGAFAGPYAVDAP
jgi:hypothetical protein